MAVHKEHFVVDDSGKKTTVLLDIEEYEKLIDDAEELEAIRPYDASKAIKDDVIPFEQAVRRSSAFGGDLCGYHFAACAGESCLLCRIMPTFVSGIRFESSLKNRGRTAHRSWRMADSSGCLSRCL